MNAKIKLGAASRLAATKEISPLKRSAVSLFQGDTTQSMRKLRRRLRMRYDHTDAEIDEAVKYVEYLQKLGALSEESKW